MPDYLPNAGAKVSHQTYASCGGTDLEDQRAVVDAVDATVPVLLLLGELPLADRQVDLGAERHHRART